MMNPGDAFFGKSAALESDFVDSIGVRVARGGSHGERQDVLRDGRASANVGMRADAHELMHRAERAHDRPFFHCDMTRDGGAVDEHGMIADHAVVADMGVSHDQQMIAEPGNSSALDGSAIDGDAFANLVVITDFQTSGLAFVSDVLRRHADGREGKEDIVRSDFGGTFDGNMRDEPAILAEFDVGSDYAVRAYLAGRGNFSAFIDNRSGVNVHGRGCTLPVASLRVPRLAKAFARTLGLILILAVIVDGTTATRAVDQLAGNYGFSYHLVADFRVALHLGSSQSGDGAPAFDYDFQSQLVARTHRPSELRALDAGEDHDLVVAILDFVQQKRPAGLRDGFDDQHAGHDRQTGKVSGEEWLVDRDIFHRDDALFPLQLQHAVDQ